MQLAMLVIAATAVTVAPSLQEQELFTPYVRNWLLGYWLLGVIVYIVDRTYGLGFWRMFQSPDAPAAGLVYNQRVKRKMFVAFIISSVETLCWVLTPWNSHLLVELFLWLADVPMMVLGFGTGALIFPLWSKRHKGYAVVDETVDKIEKGIDTIGAKKESVSPPASTPTPESVTAASAPAPQTAPVPTEPRLTPEQRIAAYAKR